MIAAATFALFCVGVLAIAVTVWVSLMVAEEVRRMLG